MKSINTDCGRGYKSLCTFEFLYNVPLYKEYFINSLLYLVHPIAQSFHSILHSQTKFHIIVNVPRNLLAYIVKIKSYFVFNFSQYLLNRQGMNFFSFLSLFMKFGCIFEKSGKYNVCLDVISFFELDPGLFNDFDDLHFWSLLVFFYSFCFLSLIDRFQMLAQPQCFYYYFTCPLSISIIFFLFLAILKILCTYYSQKKFTFCSFGLNSRSC